MTINKINKIPLTLLFVGIFGTGCQIIDSTNETFVKNNVGLSNGIDFDSTELVVIDPETGEQLTACLQPSETKDRPSAAKTETNKQACQVELFVDGNNPAIRTAIELSKRPIEGQIRRDGQQKPARFVTTLTALYKGSNCYTVTSGGTQYEFCGRRR